MGDVVGALPKVLRQMGHDVRVFMPFYGFLPDKIKIPETQVWEGTAMFQEFSIYSRQQKRTQRPADRTADRQKQHQPLIDILEPPM